MPTVAPLVTVRGTCRTVRPLEKVTDQGRVAFAAAVSVLTEPDGGFLEVTMWPRELSLGEALALAGQDVTLLVAMRVYQSDKGGAFLQADLQKVLTSV